jgi:hypothetical protein
VYRRNAERDATEKEKTVMRGVLFVLVLLTAGCARTRGPETLPEDLTESEQELVGQDWKCERRATVTVHVENRNSADVHIAFGPYAPARAAPGLGETTYSVSRYFLNSSIRLRIARGGLQTGTPPPVPTEPVVCNDATLIIGSHLRDSFFYGDKLRG